MLHQYRWMPLQITSITADCPIWRLQRPPKPTADCLSLRHACVCSEYVCFCMSAYESCSCIPLSVRFYLSNEYCLAVLHLSLSLSRSALSMCDCNMLTYTSTIAKCVCILVIGVLSLLLTCSFKPRTGA